MSLKSKIVSIVSLLIFSVLTFSSLLLVKLQQTKLTEVKLEDAEVVTSIIRQSIVSAMRKGKSHEVQEILSEIGKNREVLKVRILSEDGTILRSNEKSEIGAKSKEFLLLGKERIGKPLLREDTLYNYQLIENKKECMGCHDPTKKVNGIIELSLDFSRQRQALISLKQTLIGINALALLTVVIILGVLLRTFVVSPVNRLLKVIKNVEKGNWDARVDLETQDELGYLGEAFNQMIQELKELHDRSVKREKELSRVRTELQHKRELEELNSQLEYKIKEVETANKAIMALTKEVRTKNLELSNMVERLKKINEVGRVLTSIIESRELVKLIVKTTSELLDADRSVIHIRNERDVELSIKYEKDLGVQEVEDITLEFKGLYSDVFKRGRPMVLRQAETGPVRMSVPLKMKGKVVGAILVENSKGGLGFSHHEMEILSTFANQAMVAIENAWLYERIKTNYIATIKSLVNALEANDRYTRGHSERVRILATELGRHIGLDYKELEVLEQAAILHDIGKIGIDSTILNKNDKLTAAEYSLVKSHPLIGEEILGPIDTLEEVRTTIIQHHERYDGLGYPYGLAGEEISLKARILAVVDTFDAMLTDRPYRRAYPYERVIQELRSSAGTQFDPFLVESFIEMLEAKGRGFLIEIGYGFTLSDSRN